MNLAGYTSQGQGYNNVYLNLSPSLNFSGSFSDLVANTVQSNTISYVDISSNIVKDINTEINNLSSNIIYLSETDTNLSGRISNLSSNVISLSSSVSTLSSNIISLSTTDINLSGRISTLSSTLFPISNQIVVTPANNNINISARNFNINLSGGSVVSRLTSQSTGIIHSFQHNPSGTNLFSFNSWTNLNEFYTPVNMSSNLSISGTLTARNNVTIIGNLTAPQINTLSSTIVSLSSSIVNLSSSIETLSNNVLSLSSNIISLSSNIVSLSSRVDTLSSNVFISLSANVVSLSSRIFTLSSNVSTLSSGVLTLAIASQSLSGSIQSLSTSLFQSGRTAKSIYLGNNLGETLAQTVFSSTLSGWGTVYSYTFEPTLVVSNIEIFFHASYQVSNYAADTWLSRITVNGFEIVQYTQVWNNSAGGGTRSVALTPLYGTYHKDDSLNLFGGIAVPEDVIINIQVYRYSSDDGITFNGNFSMKVAEIYP